MIYHETEHGVIYCGDCLEVMPTLADKSVDLVLTDPPYGINYDDKSRHRPNEQHYNDIMNDDGLFDYSCMFNYFDRLASKIIIFGAENFFNILPFRGRWICWDKRLTIDADKMIGSSFELAWVNATSGYYKIYRVLHGGVVNADGGKRYHPTQKPVKLFGMILLDYTNGNDLILDPFAGSGTTGIACIRYDRRYILIEKEEKYCEIAARRIENELDQMRIEL